LAEIDESKAGITYRECTLMTEINRNSIQYGITRLERDRTRIYDDVGGERTSTEITETKRTLPSVHNNDERE